MTESQAETRHHDGVLGRIRSRSLGTARGGVPEVVLGSPVFDPAWPTLPGKVVRWLLDLRREPGGLEKVNRSERKRAGVRRLLHVLREHHRYDLTAAVGALPVRVLVVRGREDALSTRRWTRRLASLAADGRVIDVPGPHTFCWRDPDAWSEPARDLVAK